MAKAYSLSLRQRVIIDCDPELITLGALLMLFQLHGYFHMAWPKDFPLKRDDHQHIHQAADAWPMPGAALMTQPVYPHD